MKRRDLIKVFEDHGWTFLRNGNNHDIYWNHDKKWRPVPIKRHREIPEYEVKRLYKEAGIK